MSAVDDTFTGSDTDPPNTSKWVGAGALPEILSNQLRFDSDTNDWMRTVYTFTGNFDAQIDFSLATAPATTAWYAFFDIYRADAEYCSISLNYDGGKYYESADSTGGWQSIATAGTTDTSGKFRIARTGTVTTFYYDNAGWTSLGTTSKVGASDVWLDIGVGKYGANPQLLIDFDNYVKNSGPIEYDETITEGLSLADVKTSLATFYATITEAVTLSDTTARYIEIYATLTDGLSLSESVSIFNYSELLSQYTDVSAKQYTCVLTGAADSVADVTIPISNFNSRMRTGEPSYLQVTIPGIDYASYISARSNGDIVITMSWVVNGSAVLSEEIARVELETISIYEGTGSESIVLSGHKTVTYASQAITLSDITYESTQAGKSIIRTAEPDLYLRPGDVVTADATTFTVDYITTTVAIGQQQMEVRE